MFCMLDFKKARISMGLLLVTSLALCLAAAMFLLAPSAFAKESQGYWERYNEYVSESGEEPYLIADGYMNSFERGVWIRWTCAHGNYTESFEVNEDINHTESSDLAYKAGDKVTSTATYDLPKDRYRDTDKVAIGYNISAEVKKRDGRLLDLCQKLTIRMWVQYGTVEMKDGKETFIESDKIYLENSKGDGTGRVDENNPSESDTFTCELKRAYDPQTVMRIYVEINHMKAVYWYRWVDDPQGAVVGGSDEGGSSTEGGSSNGSSTENGSNNEKEPKQDVTVSTNASTEKGDFGGWIIPALIIGALVVGGGAVVLSRRGRKGDLPPDDDSGPSDDDQQEESSSTFRMVLWKDFGDCLRVGANPQTVGARIEELRSNLDNTVTVIERDDLTALIKITSGRYAHVVPAGMSGRHMTAQVDIPQGTAIDAGDKRAIVSFSLESEAGAFTSNAAFRVVGEPRITFPELTEDGTGWNEAVWLDVVRMVAGAGGTERLRFVIVDAPDEPIDINFATSEGLDISDEKDAQLAFTYYACIENRTAPMEKESGIFAEKRDVKVDVQAVFADGTTISSNFTVELWPDGLSAQVDEKDKKDGRLLVNTLPDNLRSPDSLSSEIKPTQFGLAVCYVDASGSSVILENPSVSYARKLDDGGEYGYMFSYHFAYDIHVDGKYCTFWPEDTLPMTREPYYAKLAISAKAGDRPLDGALPLALVGETPRKPSSVDWEQAFQRLRKDIELFGVGSDPEIREVLRDPYAHSAAELEFTRYWILCTGVVFYQREHEEHMRMADMCSKYITVSSALVKAGDYALKYILVAYWGKTAGTTAACFINPFKNMYWTFVGECIANGGWEKGGEKFMATLLEGCQNALAEGVTGVLKPANPEDLGYVVAAYLLTSFSKHYWYGDDYEKGDVYRSMVAACIDLNLEKFKEFLSAIAEKMWKVIGEWFGKLFKSYFAIAVEKTAEMAKSQAFEGAMRDAVKKGAVETKDLLFARSSGGLAYEAEKESMLKVVEVATSGFTKTAVEVSQGVVEAADITLGMVLNYLVGGSLEENEALGLSTMDVLIGFLDDRLKVKARPVYGIITNKWDISIRLDEGAITASILGYTVEIPFFENMVILEDMVLDYAFGWMKAIFETAIPPARGVPDKRDSLDEGDEAVEQAANDLKRLKPITYKGWKGYHGIGADEQMGGQ